MLCHYYRFWYHLVFQSYSRFQSCYLLRERYFRRFQNYFINNIGETGAPLDRISCFTLGMFFSKKNLHLKLLWLVIHSLSQNPKRVFLCYLKYFWLVKKNFQILYILSNCALAGQFWTNDFFLGHNWTELNKGKRGHKQLVLKYYI